jgi:hypothetical protein
MANSVAKLFWGGEQKFSGMKRPVRGDLTEHGPRVGASREGKRLAQSPQKITRGENARLRHHFQIVHCLEGPS